MTGRRLGVASAMVDGRVVPGDVEVDGTRVSAVGVGGGSGTGLAVAGFVDLQVNGFAGIDFTATDLDGYRAASAAIGRTGVTSFLATIPTTSPERYPAALAAAAEAGAGPLAGAASIGIHLEGPFLAPTRAGAHRPEWLRSPADGDADTLLGAPGVALITLAPELDGGLDLIRRARERGVVVSIGHSDARAPAAHDAFDAGARAITHLWNAHRPISSRDPGIGGVALARADVAVRVIADLIHIAAETLRFTAAAAGDRLVVVSDAVAPAGLGDGEHRFGAEVVTVRDGAVRLVDGTLAGSACALDQALRNLVATGVPLGAAIDAITTAPARLLGRPDLGRLHIGGPADIVVLDDDLTIEQVLVVGTAVR